MPRSSFNAWVALKSRLMKKNPYKSRPCVICGTAPFEVFDHIKPHNGDLKLLLSVRNIQPLCMTCHSSVKAKMEGRGRTKEPPKYDEEGYPIVSELDVPRYIRSS